MKRKLFSLLLVAVLCFGLAMGISAASEADIYDEADLLSDAEEMQLSEKLSEIGQQYKVQLVVATVSSVDGSIDTFVEEVYDGMDMGVGEQRDGVLLLISMNPREYRILSNGYAGVAIDGAQIDAIGNAIVSDLSDGAYASAFTTFADKCEDALDRHLNGEPFKVGKTLIVALIIGLVAGVIVALILRGQLKSVRRQNQANAYIKNGSMQITTSRDLFLYRQVSRTKRETSNSSGSGASRSVGGGSF